MTTSNSTGPTSITGTFTYPGSTTINTVIGNPWNTSHGTGYAISTNGNYIPLSPEEMRKNQEEAEVQRVKLQERLDALKTFFPRAHQQIQNLEIMEEIARENQLNPLYEQVLEEFDNAKAAMSRAANKLATAVKLTDLDEIELRVKRTAHHGISYASMGAMSASGASTSAGSASSLASATSARTSATSASASATSASNAVTAYINGGTSVSVASVQGTSPATNSSSFLSDLWSKLTFRR